MSRSWHNVLPSPVGFVFSGGASLGAIQAGMLLALREAQLEPDVIVGASVGSLNGAIVAERGLDEGADVLDSLWRNMKTDDVFPIGRLTKLRHYLDKRSSIFPNKNLKRLIANTLNSTHFSQLKHPFAALATELFTKHGALFTSGDLHNALLASTAIPGIYPPVKINGKYYVDGALVANLPMRQAMQMGAKSLVILDAGELCHLNKVPANPAAMFLGMLQATMRQRARVETRQLANELPILFLPTPCSLSKNLLDFSNGAPMIEAAQAMSHDFLQDAPIPIIGAMSGAPHHHDTLPIQALTKILRA